VSFVLDDLQQVEYELLLGSSEATLVLFRDSTQAVCVPRRVEIGPFCCLGDQNASSASRSPVRHRWTSASMASSIGARCGVSHSTVVDMTASDTPRWEPASWLLLMGFIREM